MDKWTPFLTLRIELLHNNNLLFNISMDIFTIFVFINEMGIYLSISYIQLSYCDFILHEIKCSCE